MALRDYRPEFAYYAKEARAEAVASLPPSALWSEVSSIGGAAGYYYMTWLWNLRGMLDRMAGGVGMCRGRRHPTDVRVGDAIDFWRVVAVEPPRRLTLAAEMKLPGSAILEFEVKPESAGQSRVIVTAHFHPAGAPGLLYWRALKPIHAELFHGLARAIVDRAKAKFPRVIDGRTRKA